MRELWGLLKLQQRKEKLNWFYGNSASWFKKHQELIKEPWNVIPVGIRNVNLKSIVSIPRKVLALPANAKHGNMSTGDSQTADASSRADGGHLGFETF